MSKKRPTKLYRVLRWMLFTAYPHTRAEGTENLPDEPVIIVGNHAQMHGPIVCEFYSPMQRYTWCAAQMMHLREVPAYAYQDFWSQKPRYSRPFYKLLSYIIAPLASCIFQNANTIGVYHDARVVTTFKHTVTHLQAGDSVVIFPEHDVAYNHILSDFQNRFIDVAKLYYKKTGKEICFVPLYVAPSLKAMYYGKPIRFCADTPLPEERERIRRYLMEEITAIACALPRHKVVPYRNIGRRKYPYNKDEVNHHETSGR
ncbi:MAG: hypothetical protein IJP14_04105 [Clostridia bacterium]|nr:hypothetical protein [Clostridia bacterium]